MKLEKMKFKFMDLQNYYIKCIAKYGQRNHLKYFKQRMQFFLEDLYTSSNLVAGLVVNTLVSHQCRFGFYPQCQYERWYIVRSDGWAFLLTVWFSSVYHKTTEMPRSVPLKKEVFGNLL